MRLWSIQPELLYERLCVDKVIHCNPEESEWVTKCNFGPAYDWLAEQMTQRIGLPPLGIKYPIWAWHTMRGKHQKPDLRWVEFRADSGVCLELEIPDQDVLLNDEEVWYYVLGDWFYGDCANEQESEAEDNWFESLSPDVQRNAKRKSWEKIFKTNPSGVNNWYSSGKFIQATFWELRLDQVISVRHLKERRKSNHI